MIKPGYIFGSVGFVFVLLTLFVFTSYVSAYNFGNRMEKQIKAEYTNMENVLGSYSTKVVEVASVSSEYSKQVKETVQLALQGRYGPNGARAVFQMITENNPSIDPTVFLKVQTIIEAGRNEFQNSQTRFIDVKRTYETGLGYFWRGTLLAWAGYPKINLDDYQIISSEYATEAFRTHRAATIKLYGE